MKRFLLCLQIGTVLCCQFAIGSKLAAQQVVKEPAKIETAIAEHEAKVQFLVEQMRQQSRTLAPQHPDRVKARRELEKTLTDALELKFQQEQTQLNELAERLSRMQTLFEHRKSSRQAIVQRRLRELTESDGLDWNSGGSTVPKSPAKSDNVKDNLSTKSAPPIDTVTFTNPQSATTLPKMPNPGGARSMRARVAGGTPQNEAVVQSGNQSPHDDLHYRGGRTIRNLQFINIYVGGNSAWDANDWKNIDAALAAAMSDTHLNNVIRQYFGHLPISASFQRSFFHATWHPSTVSKSDLERQISDLYWQGALKGMELPNTVFNFMLPKGVILSNPHIIDDATSSEDSFAGLAGYHGSVHLNDETVYYTVGVYSEHQPSGQTNGIPVFDQNWKNVVATFYQELQEARTNPDVEDAGLGLNLLGWTSDSGNEIGDYPIEETNQLARVFAEVPLANGSGTVPIQFVYSNAVHGPEGPIASPHETAPPYGVNLPRSTEARSKRDDSASELLSELMLEETSDDVVRVKADEHRIGTSKATEESAPGGQPKTISVKTIQSQGPGISVTPEIRQGLEFLSQSLQSQSKTPPSGTESSAEARGAGQPQPKGSTSYPPFDPNGPDAPVLPALNALPPHYHSQIGPVWLEAYSGLKLELVKPEGLKPYPAALRVQEPTNGLDAGDLIVALNHRMFESIDQAVANLYPNSKTYSTVVALHGGIDGVRRTAPIGGAGLKRDYLLPSEPGHSTVMFETQTQTAGTESTETTYVDGICLSPDGLVVIPLPAKSFAPNAPIIAFGKVQGTARVVAADDTTGLTLVKLDCPHQKLFDWITFRDTLPARLHRAFYLDGDTLFGTAVREVGISLTKPWARSNAFAVKLPIKSNSSGLLRIELGTALYSVNSELLGMIVEFPEPAQGPHEVMDLRYLAIPTAQAKKLLDDYRKAAPAQKPEDVSGK